MPSWMWVASGFLGAVGLLSFVNEAAKHIIEKLTLFGLGALHFVLSKDRKWSKQQPNPDSIKDAKDAKVKKIIFVRHGESVWNEVFNKGFGPSFIVRLATALYRETLYLPSRDSVFADSPLSHEGVQQTRKLYAAVGKCDPATKEGAVLALLAAPGGASAPSLLVASNLRRAIATLAIAAGRRLESAPSERIHIVSSLQEISRNVDTLATAAAGKIPDLVALEEELAPWFQASGRFATAANNGNKPLSSNGMARMHAFLDWAYSRPESVIIVAGHSLWFRTFFQTFLPPGVEHVAKKKKMVNCGVVAFDVSRASNGGTRPVHRIIPESLVSAYGGFEK